MTRADPGGLALVSGMALGASYMLGQPAVPPPGAVPPLAGVLGVEAGGGVVGDVWAHATAAPPPSRPATTAPPATACLSLMCMAVLSVITARDERLSWQPQRRLSEQPGDLLRTATESALILRPLMPGSPRPNVGASRGRRR
jgi:hypothetical protein